MDVSVRPRQNGFQSFVTLLKTVLQILMLSGSLVRYAWLETNKLIH